ncbi:MAG: thioredoxin domain-containing protein, partial [Bryobacteraceae bacterium]
TGACEADLAAALEASRIRLRQEREQRPRPLRDEKILTGWNGLMLSALARAWRVLDEPRYGEAAQTCAAFLLERMYEGQTLWRRWWRGEAGIPGFLEDYAFLIQGLLDLYEASLDARYLERALELSRQQCAYFEDERGGGFFSSREDPMLPVRLKDGYDGAEPSANSVSALNLLRLAAITGEGLWLEKGQRTVGAFARQMIAVPDALPLMLATALNLPGGLRQVVLEGNPHSQEFQALHRAVVRGFFPHVVAVRAEEVAASGIGALPARGPARARAHVCENFSCQASVSDPAELLKQLTGSPGSGTAQ